MRRLVGVFGVTVVLASACKGKMAKIDAVHDALVADDTEAIKRATKDLPGCPDEPAVATNPGASGPRDGKCLSDIANALGSKRGFTPPDHAATTTAAVVLVRDGRGDYLVHPDNWFAIMKNNKGVGADTLRLAVARMMADNAPLVGRKIEDEARAHEAMKAVTAAIPGACPTYWLLGSGVENSKLAPELTADHSACVHKDLSRRDGPGGAYGQGTFRALEGALAEWREAERSLRLGLAKAAPKAKAVIEKKLAVIEAATQKIETKKDDSTRPREVLERLGELHAEAGVVLWKSNDAGADAASDAEAPRDRDHEPRR